MTPRQNNHSRAKVLWILRSLPLIVAVKYWCYVWEIKQLIGGERCHFCNFISVAQRCVLVINWCSCFEEVLLKTTYSCYSCAQRDWSSWIKGLENVLSLVSFDTLSLGFFVDCGLLNRYCVMQDRYLSVWRCFNSFSSSAFTSLLVYDCHTNFWLGSANSTLVDNKIYPRCHLFLLSNAGEIYCWVALLSDKCVEFLQREEKMRSELRAPCEMSRTFLNVIWILQTLYSCVRNFYWNKKRLGNFQSRFALFLQMLSLQKLCALFVDKKNPQISIWKQTILNATKYQFSLLVSI